MVAEAACHIAEQRDFRGGQAPSDWLWAQAEVGVRFSKGGLSGYCVRGRADGRCSPAQGCRRWWQGLIRKLRFLVVD
jgi:hypothetical protein